MEPLDTVPDENETTGATLTDAEIRSTGVGVAVAPRGELADTDASDADADDMDADADSSDADADESDQDADADDA